MCNVNISRDTSLFCCRSAWPAGIDQRGPHPQDTWEHAHLLLALLHELIEGSLEHCHSGVIAGCEAGAHIRQGLEVGVLPPERLLSLLCRGFLRCGYGLPSAHSKQATHTQAAHVACSKLLSLPVRGCHAHSNRCIAPPGVPLQAQVTLSKRLLQPQGARV